MPCHEHGKAWSGRLRVRLPLPLPIKIHPLWPGHLRTRIFRPGIGRVNVAAPGSWQLQLGAVAYCCLPCWVADLQHNIFAFAICLFR